MIAIWSLAINYLITALSVYQYLLMLYVIASWFGGLPHNSLGDFVRDLVEPFLRQMQKFPHRFGPIDISVIYAFVIIDFTKMLILKLVEIL